MLDNNSNMTYGQGFNEALIYIYDHVYQNSQRGEKDWQLIICNDSCSSLQLRHKTAKKHKCSEVNERIRREAESVTTWTSSTFIKGKKMAKVSGCPQVVTDRKNLNSGWTKVNSMKDEMKRIDY